MKKVILILGLSLLSLIAFAGNDVTTANTKIETKIEVSVDLLKPIAPSEATFEDVDSLLKIECIKLAPVTPKEADFNE